MRSRLRRLLIAWVSYEELILVFLIIIHQGEGKNNGPPPGRPPQLRSLPPGVVANDGRVNLILHAYLNKLSEELRKDAQLKLTDQQADVVIHRLRGLYNHLKDHPALMEGRLMVGGRRPDLFDYQDPEEPIPETETSDHHQDEILVSKRKLEIPLTEACPSVTEWLSLNKSRDIHDQEVEIFQPGEADEEAQLGAQFFYSTRCVKDVENHPCTGTSFLYNSKCLTRVLLAKSFSKANWHPPVQRCQDLWRFFERGLSENNENSAVSQTRGYVMALVRKKPDDVFDWNWIQVSASCNCGISKKF